MDSRMRIRPLEALLGFKFANGVSRSKGLRQDPILSELLSGFDFINEEYKAYNTKQVHTSVEIKLEADRLFDRLGPSLWPGPTEPRPNWLLRPSGYNEHPFAHLYSRDLFFSNPDDRKTLSENFYNLVCAKVLGYHSNQQSKKQQKTREPPDGERLPETEESEYHSRNSSGSLSDHEIGTYGETSDSDSDYEETTATRRNKSHRKNSRPSTETAMRQHKAPTACMRHPPDPMGSVQTKLDSLRAESSGSFGMNSSSDAAGRRDRRHSPPMFVASTSSRATLDEEDASYRTGTSNHGKRAATQERLETKRSKLANELSDGSTESSENPQKVIQGVHTSDPRLFGSKQSPIMRGGPGNNMGPAPGGSRSRMYQETRENVDGPTASDVSGSFGARGPAAFAERPNTQTQNQTYRANQTPAATPDPLPTTAPQEDDDSSLLREPQSETLRTVAEAAIEATKISSMGRHRLEVQTPTRQHRNASEPQSSAAHDEYHRGDPTGADSTEKGDDSSSAAHPSTTGASIPQTGLSEDSGQGHAPIQRNQEATGQAVTAGVEHFEMDENLSKKWLAIYLSDQAQMHSAIIPPGELRTKESMFAAIDEELQDDIGPDEAVVAIKITRVDGGAFEGTGIIPMIPVKKRGASLTWDILARFISRNGAGEGGLKGVVNVQKVNVDTRSG